MKLDRAKVCPECDEVYEGPQCPQCTNEQGIWLGKKVVPLASGRVRRVEEPSAMKLRAIQWR
jgi:hypothetical protein